LLFNIASLSAFFGVTGVVEQAAIANASKTDSVNLNISVFITELFLLLNLIKLVCIHLIRVIKAEARD